MLYIVLNLQDFTTSDGQVVPPNTILNAFIPRQLDSQTKELVSYTRQTTSDATLTSFAVNFGTNFVGNASLGSLFSAINTIQVMVTSNLMDIKVPANVNFVMINFYEIATFDALPEDIHQDTFNFPDNGPYNANFGNTGYGSTYAVSNMGSMFWVVSGNIVISLILLVLAGRKCNCKCLRKIITWFSNKLYWNGYLLLMTEIYLDACINFIMNIKTSFLDEVLPIEVFSKIFSIVGLCVLMLGPILAFGVAYRKRKQWTTDEWSAKYGSLFD